MHKPRVDRRQFVKTLAGSAAAASAMPARGFAAPLVAQAPPRIRFSVIGINHGHINSQVQAVQRGGGELVSMFAREADLTAAFVKRFPTVKVVKSEEEIYADKSIQLIVSAAIPDGSNARSETPGASLARSMLYAACRAVMRRFSCRSIGACG